uniref:Uncharacterized protein n=1 Tax=Rhizophora mucronata TaxID=61149 RepID=A0A2P2PZC5_RHIMU
MSKHRVANGKMKKQTRWKIISLYYYFSLLPKTNQNKICKKAKRKTVKTVSTV